MPTAPSATDAAVQHPLDRITGGGVLKAAVRVGVCLLILAGVVWFTGDKLWAQLLKLEHLPYFAVGIVMVAAQRVARVRKWSAVVKQTDLIQRSWLYLLQIQFAGLMANLLIPVSEALKIWAVSREKRDAITAVETLTVDSAALSLMVAVLGTVGVLATLGDAHVWIWIGAGALLLASIGVMAAVHYRLRRFGKPGWYPPVIGWSLLEATLLVLVYGCSLTAIGVEVSPMVLLAIYPLLYLSHLVMLTPSGLGLREALFALVFAGLSDAPTETAVAAGLMISGMQLVVSVVGGTVAMVLPGARLR